MKRVLLWAVLCGAVASSVAATDCNQNGLEDAQDIASGSSEDCNSNGIPDECDLAPGRIDFVGASRVLAEGGGLAVADLDGDGLRDAVTVSFGTDPDDPGDEVFCSRNLGDAFFDEPVKFPCPEYPEVVACADLDGDGDEDIVVSAGAYPFVQVFRNDGHMGFTAGESWALSGGALALGDVNGDDLPDIVTTGKTRTQVSVIVNRGAAHFFGPVNYDCGSDPAAVVLADFSSDGDLDIAIGSSVRSAVSFLENRGDGTYQARTTVPLDGPPRVLFAADLDGDRRPELVAGIPSLEQIVVVRSRGLIAPAYYDTDSDPVAIAGGDLDGDRDLDICVANGSGATTQLFLNDGDAGLRPSSARLPTSGELAISDLDGDGDRDIVVHTTVYRNNGNARFRTAIRLSVGDGPEGVALADLDGDGLLDIAAACLSSDDVSVILHASSRTFASAQSFAVGNAPVEIAAADLDGDGDEDLAVANRVSGGVSILKNTGSGTFSAAASVSVGSAPDDLALGDIDKDGDPDLAAANPESTEIRVLRNQGDGTFQAPFTVECDAYVVDVVLADMTGDGYPDIVAGLMASPEVLVIRNLGGRRFASVPDHGLGIFEDMYVSVGDLDGDGDLDAAAWLDEFIDPDGGTFEVTTRLKLFENDGAGNLAARSTIVKGGRPDGIALADLDGDSWMDVVGLTSHDHVLVQRNLGGFTLGSPSAWTAGSRGDVAAGDLDGDGKPDLVAADELGDRVVILFNDTAPPASLDANEDGVPDECEQMPFVRGDANADGTVDLSDGIYVLGYLFLGLAPPPCLRSADGDGNAVLEISDAIYVIGYLFLGGGPPPAPFPDCGSSPTEDELGCGSFAPCSA